MKFEPTQSQRDAMEAEGNVLVSAAAGSGKTAVLVERVISKLTDAKNPVSADRLLIVTFTNAAAAEMRSRIEKRLDEESRKFPEDLGLRKQRYLIGSAKIGTIDSFCIDLIRENFEKLGIRPDFKIYDEKKLLEINRVTAKRLFDEYLEEGSKDFFHLLDILGSDYDESVFLDSVLELYSYSRQFAEPAKWFDRVQSAYEAKDFQDCALYSGMMDTARQWCGTLDRHLHALKEHIYYSEDTQKTLTPYLEKIQNLVTAWLEAAERNDWDALARSLEDTRLPSPPKIKGGDDFEEAQIAVGFESILKQTFAKLKTLFFAETARINEVNAYLREPIALLCEILRKLEDRIFAEYLNRNLLTFHNAEHLALRLLEETPELAENFDEVMVDEYQDVNDLQDRLFFILSGGEKRLFTVGDVKQSIYGFRGAAPDKFIEKKARCVPVEQEQAGKPTGIVLANNFRSRAGVCDFVNFFFGSYMTARDTGVEYGGEECLIPTAAFPDNGQECCEMHIVTNGDNAAQSLVNEAAVIAERIEELIQSEPFLRGRDGALRRVEYRDVTILLRSLKNKGAVYVEELRKRGIPVSFVSEGYADTVEISVFLSLLKVIDNPLNSVELLCVMLSPIFSFTAQEVAALRVENPAKELYTSLTQAASLGHEKAKAMTEKLRLFRKMAVSAVMPDFILKLLYESGYIYSVLVMQDGDMRQKNLLLLPRYAEEFVEMGGDGLNRFVDYIIRQSESGLESASASGGENAVRIMTMHASKGLQFPICILAGLSVEFNKSDDRAVITRDAENGVGLLFDYPITKERMKTAVRQNKIAVLRKQSLSEELRLLYVAMTRAEEKLILVAAPQNVEKSIAKAKALCVCSGENTEDFFERCSSAYEWLLALCIRHPDCHALRAAGSRIVPMKTNCRLLLRMHDVPEQTPPVLSKIDLNPDEAAAERIAEGIVYRYPYACFREIQSKASVSDIANKAEAQAFAFTDRPAFMSNGVTAAERGTAIHKIMQFIDFSKCDDIPAEIDRLREWMFISEAEAQCADLPALQTFFSSSLFQRIRKSPLVKREMRFLTEMPARTLSPDLPEDPPESIVVQGAVDLCFEEDGEMVVVDFKTDRVNEMEQLKEAYAEQLRIYSQACGKIFQKPVKERILYSFRLGESIVF